MDSSPVETPSNALPGPVSRSNSRTSSTKRIKPQQHASNTSLKQAYTTLPTDKTLTSFPSLSPSVENSPESRKEQRTIRASRDNETRSRVAKRIPSALDGLFDAPAPARDRLALFVDTPRDVRELPGTLHLQSDEHIRHLIARTGAIKLVRQLATDVAQRDAQATLLQHRAEERERLLRGILRECGLDKMDIDNRLRELETSRQDSIKHQSAASSRRTSGASKNYTPQAETVPDRLVEALDESMEPVGTIATNGIWYGRDAQNQHVSRNATTSSHRHDDNVSVASSIDVDSQASSDSRGWKSFFRYGAGAANSMENADNIGERRISAQQARTSVTQPSSARLEASDDLFRPPHAVLVRSSSSQASLADNLRRTQSTTAAGAEAPPAKASSVSSWALRLVGGMATNTAKASTSESNRNRAATVAGATAPKKAESVTATKRMGQKSSARPTLNGLSNRSSPDVPRSRPSLPAPPMSPRSPVSAADTSLGPVEMDTILPEDTRPPTLLQQHNLNMSSEYLTDRFGFIYDQRRKKRQDEAQAAIPEVDVVMLARTGDTKISTRSLRSNLEEDTVSSNSQNAYSASDTGSQTPVFAETDEKKSAVRWQDYLKISNVQTTELLSHTPFTAPITSVTVAEEPSEAIITPPQVLMAKGGAAPAIGSITTSSATRTISENAEISQPSTAGTISSEDGPLVAPPDTIKLLLEQLTEVHDANQREKTVRWNEFLRKVRAERKREGGAAAGNDGRSKTAAMPETSMTDGEVIGVSGLGNKGKVGRAKWNEFRNLVLGGIPVAFRAKIWAECSGASEIRIPGYYEDLIKNEDSDPVIITQIQMDITRTLTDNIFFRKGPGIKKLREVLVAYAQRNREVGYCQGMNLITACLLLIMPTAEDAFWVLVCMIEKILPEKYYDSSLQASRADQVVLRQYVSEILPTLSNHLDNLSIELEALTFQWFLSVFTDCLSAEALFRVWDVVLCVNDGATFLFQVAVALLSLNEKQLLSCETSAEIYAYINHGVTDHAIAIDGLVRASDALKARIRREDVVKRRIEAIERDIAMMRRTERSLKGKGRAVETSTTSVEAEEHPSRPGHATAMLDSSLEDEEELEYGELTIRTPMPIDEEAFWRG